MTDAREYLTSIRKAEERLSLKKRQVENLRDRLTSLSVPTDKEVVLDVEGTEDSQVTLELEAEKDYKIHIDNIYVGKMKTNLGGKLNLSVELEPGKLVNVKIEKM